MKVKIIILIAVFCCFYSSGAFAVHFSFENADADEVFRILRKELGYAISGAEQIKVKANLSTRGEVSAEQAYDIFNEWLMSLEPAYTAVRNKNLKLLKIIPLSNALFEDIKIFNNPGSLPDSSEIAKVTKLLDKMDVIGIEPVISQFKSSWGTIIIDKSMKSFIIVDEMKKINKMLIKINELESRFNEQFSKLKYRTFECSYTYIRETALQIMRILGFSREEMEKNLNIKLPADFKTGEFQKRMSRVDLTINEEKNYIYIVGLPEDIALAETIFKSAEQEAEELYKYRLSQYLLFDVYFDAVEKEYKAVFLNRANNKRIVVKKGEQLFPNSKMYIDGFVEDKGSIKVIIKYTEGYSVGSRIIVK